MASSRRRSYARSIAAFIIGLAVIAPSNAFEASAAPNLCPAQQIGRFPTWRPDCVKPAIPPLSRSAYVEIDLLARLNAERRARGVAPLTSDPRLVTFARGWSANMASSGFRHSDIRRLFEGRFNYVGENIAWAGGPDATAGLVHRMWMQSTGHRQNMLSPAFDRIGIGVFCGPDGRLWATQNFGRSSALGSPPSVATPPANPLVRSDDGLFHC